MIGGLTMKQGKSNGTKPTEITGEWVTNLEARCHEHYIFWNRLTRTPST
jgi:hypothetical protein